MDGCRAGFRALRSQPARQRRWNSKARYDMNGNTLPCCLTVAGSDSGGNAGVQADLRAFHAYGVHGCTVFTALTAQNPSGVSAIHPVPADFVAAQLDAVLGVYAISAMKTGMLADPASIEAIAERLSAHPGIFKVIDPVMVATSGARLVSADAADAMTRLLFPLAGVLTPNLPEAKVLCGEAQDPAAWNAGRDGSPERYARKLFDMFGRPVLVKGGHLASGAAVDVLFDGSETRAFSMDWVGKPVSTHGTGCSLAAAIAAATASGLDLADAVASAKSYVHDAIASSAYVGGNCGVLGFAPRFRKS